MYSILTIFRETNYDYYLILIVAELAESHS